MAFKKAIFLSVAILFAAFAFLQAPVSPGFAAEPPKGPMLRLETGMHTDGITQVSMDRENRWLATASIDKTVRLWDLSSGKMVRVLRPPLSSGDEGKLYAVAVSPDGSRIACGGWTKLGSESGFTAYIFEAATGRMTGRITGLPAMIDFMAYSKDGRFLAVCLKGKNGIRVYHADTLTLAGEDRDYGDACSGGDFSLDGRLVTASKDGYIRLYNSDFRLKAKEKRPRINDPRMPDTSGGRKGSEGKDPYRVQFSPDGSRIAVGFDNSKNVEVLSSRDLSYLYTPNTQGLWAELECVSWSADGQYLYAGGSYSKVFAGYQIVRWAGAGRGARTEYDAGEHRITDIHPLNTGGVAYSTSEPSWGVRDGQGLEKLKIRPSSVEHIGWMDSFWVSRDGMQVQFRYKKWYKGDPGRFNVPTRVLDTNPGKDSALSLPVSKSPILRVTDWSHQYNPKLNGQALKLSPNEMSRSLAIAPDNESFVLGTDWYLRCFDRSGKQKWRVRVATAWAVNITGDGKMAVAALNDATVRWYRLSDGKQLLAFFPHRDKKRWVLWTPGGYYDASEGADELIGWHLNNGRDKEASFYPVSRFFEQFYRPDVVTDVLKSVEPDKIVIARLGESGKANLQAGLKKPPVVAILTPKKGAAFDTEEIEVSVQAQDQGGGISEIRLYHNGKAVAEDTRAMKVVSKGDTRIKTFTVQLLEGPNTLSASAFSAERIEGNPAEIGVTLLGVAKTSELHLVIVGINKYKNPALNLNYAEPDAKGIEDFFTKSAVKKLFSAVHIHRLLNEEATTAKIKKLFADVRQRARPQDTVILYLAGHGDSIGSDWYFIPHDIVTPEMEEDLKKDGISTKDITETVKGFKSQKVFVMIDACKSGGMVVAMRGFEERKALLQLARSSGTYVISASTDKQLAAEVRQLGHGVFTYVLLEGLSGKAGDKKVTVESLIAYVKNRLPDVTQKYRGAPQYPISWGTGMDFPLAIIK